jgi:hypothetical protein
MVLSGSERREEEGEYEAKKASTPQLKFREKRKEQKKYLCFFQRCLSALLTNLTNYFS